MDSIQEQFKKAERTERKVGSAQEFNDKFITATVSLFGTPEGRAYLRMLKYHPEIKYYLSSAKAGKAGTGQGEGCAYYDGVKHPIRIIDQILDNSK